MLRNLVMIAILLASATSAFASVDEKTINNFALSENNFGANLSVILIAGEHDLEFNGHLYPINQSGEFILIDRRNETVFIRADGYSDMYIGKATSKLDFSVLMHSDVEVAVPDGEALPSIMLPSWMGYANLTANLQNNTVCISA